jgi:hypothetical protein
MIFIWTQLLLSAQADEYASNDIVYNWSDENLLWTKQGEKNNLVKQGEGIRITSKTTVSVRKKSVCTSCFPLNYYLIRNENGNLQSSSLSRLPLFTFQDYWENHMSISDYIQKSKYFGSVSQTWKKEWDHGYEMYTSFEKGATVLVTSKSGGIVNDTQIFFPRITLQEGYLFTYNWLGKWIVSETYKSKNKTIYFALSSELSCSEQGYTLVEETKSPKGVKITYHSVCD